MVSQEETLSVTQGALSDPTVGSLARIYATAFLNAAGADAAEALEECLSFQDDVLAKNSEFRTLLLNVGLKPEDAQKLIDRVVTPRASARFSQFLKVLAKHERLQFLPIVLDHVRRLHEERTGKQRVQVTSAHPLNQETLQRIHDRMAASLPFDPILESNVDSNLLGGLVIRIGDTVYDSSLRSRLKQLTERMRQRSLHEIQSGRDRFSHPTGD